MEPVDNMSDFGLNITGMKDLQRAIAQLAPELQNRAYKSVITEGGRVIQREAKSRVARKSGLLRKSINVKGMVFKSGTAHAIIGIKRSVRGKPKTVIGRNGKSRKVTPTPANYAHLVEYGTAHSAAAPFMRPAVDATKNTVFAGMVKGLDKALSRAVRKIAKTGKR